MKRLLLLVHCLSLLIIIATIGGCGSAQGNQTTTPKIYFTLSEFSCKNGDTFTIEARNNIENITIPMINQPRSQCDFSWDITSGYRSIEYNAQVHGASGSLHIKGLASDIAIYSTEMRYVIVKWSTYYNIPQIIIYSGNWIHLSHTNTNQQILCVGGFDS
jgi:hypothetical protein